MSDAAAAEVINAGCDRIRAVVTDPAVWCTATVLAAIEQHRAEALAAIEQHLAEELAAIERHRAEELAAIEQHRAEALLALRATLCPPLPPDLIRPAPNERWS